MQKHKNIAALNELGQSIWIDNLSRAMLNSGELRAMIAMGVSGLTSNPTIFKQAIADSSLYDEEMRPLAKKGLSKDEICEELMLEDVRRAADELKGVYASTNGGDGFASLEVSPTLAHDTSGTLTAARRLWSKLGRPNVMIKIPATPEGLPAIESALAEGINVNVTLIFSVPVYEQVFEAYTAALETRAAKGEPLTSIASVASFFVSRVDAIHEKEFEALLKRGSVQESSRSSFLGKVGIANSRLAYERFQQLSTSPRFKALVAKGARVQRPLWASTGTKNPAFSPTMYVEELAGKDTVNTIPPQTLKALTAGVLAIGPKLHSGYAEAHRLVESVIALGLPFHELLITLRDQGVVLFADSYRDLVESIEQKRVSLRG
ncbi:MAG: transaldolase [Bdellovibrionota bacterium]|nr:MAG: transaldolase [Bdellovibrionota bacterium]